MPCSSRARVLSGDRARTAPRGTTNTDGTRVMRAVLHIAAQAEAQGHAVAGDVLNGAGLAPEVEALLESHRAEFGIDAAPATAFAAQTALRALSTLR